MHTVTHDVVAAKTTFVGPEFIVAPDDDFAKFQQYLAGQSLYMAKEPVEACQNDDQVRGWWDALKHDAETA